MLLAVSFQLLRLSWDISQGKMNLHQRINKLFFYQIITKEINELPDKTRHINQRWNRKKNKFIGTSKFDKCEKGSPTIRHLAIPGGKPQHLIRRTWCLVSNHSSCINNNCKSIPLVSEENIIIDGRNCRNSPTPTATNPEETIMARVWASIILIVGIQDKEGRQIKILTGGMSPYIKGEICLKQFVW